VAAGSVWGGGGIRGYRRQWRATLNGLEGMAALHSDALLLLDEIAEIEGKEAGGVAYMLGNGQGKSRAKRDGSGRAPATWRSLFLSTGETTLADKIQEDGRRKATAGSGVRVADLPAEVGEFGAFETIHEATSADVFADTLRADAERYYGTAIRAFLTRLVGDLDRHVARLRTLRDSFFTELKVSDSDGQVRRVANRFALIAAAGQLATEFEITGWNKDKDPNSISHAMVSCFNAWVTQRGSTKGPQELEDGIKQIRKFIEENGESRFAPIGGNCMVNKEGELVDIDRPTMRRVGFRTADSGGGIDYLVMPESFRRELCDGFDSAALATELIRREMLISSLDKKTGKVVPTVSKRIPALSKTARVFHLRSTILLGDEEPSDAA